MTKQSPVGLQEAADQLGVHYMTAYRYVRTGRLVAWREGGRWLVDNPASQQALVHADRPRRSGTGASTPATTPHPGRIERLRASLLRGDEAAVWRQIEDLLTAGTEPEPLYLRVLTPAMEAIGEAWAAGELDVGAEHRATAVMVRVIGRLGPLFVARGRKRGTILLGVAAGDRHSLPVTLLADPLRGRRFEVVDLGGDVPALSFGASVKALDRLVAVGVCATTARPKAVRGAIAAVREATAAPVVLGGAAIRDQGYGLRLGADYVSPSASEALDIFESLSSNVPSGRSSRVSS
ncbi:MAG: B12-binding domain-containing protein [Actinobacteria bacterium]|nr:B12-binding domain-containing protein [Actinomycetota bacterium]